MTTDLTDAQRRHRGLLALDLAAEQARTLIGTLADAAKMLEPTEAPHLDPLAVQVSSLGAATAVGMNAVAVAVTAERRGR
jgi:hypothetical protein